MVTKTVGELVDDERRGSADARDELVRRHYREIALVAVAITNDPTEAEDLSQEAFIRAFRNLDLLVDPNRFAPWLRRIVVGVSIDWLRSFRPNLFRGWDDSDDVAIATGPSPLDRVLHAEMAERVAAALNALPPRYRVPVRLYHLDGLSHAKIAASLDVPVATVRSLVARARRKLAPLLAAYAPDDAGTTGEVFEEQAVAEAMPTRFLHGANGTCTTSIIEAAGIPGARSIWADPLYEGPVPGGVTDEEVLEARRRFHAGAAAAPHPAHDTPRRRGGRARSGQRHAALAERHRGARRIRRAGALVRARSVRSAQSDSASQLGAEPAAVTQASEPGLDQRVPRPRGVQGTGRAVGRRARVAVRHAPRDHRGRVRARGEGMAGVSCAAAGAARCAAARRRHPAAVPGAGARPVA